MDVLGLEELVELAYTISGMKLPGLLALSGKKQKTVGGLRTDNSGAGGNSSKKTFQEKGKVQKETGV